MVRPHPPPALITARAHRTSMSTHSSTPGSPASPNRAPEAHAPELATTTGPFDLPTMTGGIPVLEDAVNDDPARFPSVRQLGESPARVTALVIAVLTTLSAIGPLATDMYIPAFPQVTRDLATTAASLQLTLTAFFMGVAGGQIVAGPLSDRLGRRAPLIVGIVLCLVGSIACALAPSVTWLLVARIVQGIGGGFGMVLGRAVLIDLTEGPELFRTLNIMQGISGVAPIVAPLLGGLILIVGEWREVFWVIAGMSLLSLVGVLTLIPESLPKERRHAGGFRTFLKNGGTLLRRRLFVTYMLLNAFSAFALLAYVSASTFVVQDMLGFDSTIYSVSFAVNSTGMMCMSFLSARLSRDVPPRTLIGIGLSISAFAALLLLVGTLVFDTPAWIVFPGFFLLVSAQGLIFGNGGALASRESLDMAGTGSALLGLGFSIAASAAAPLVGLAGTHSSLPMALTMVAGVAISFFCYVLAGRVGTDRGADGAVASAS